ncbi:MAG: bifunctional phosphopantothenoylcysteine decarboxylase/phosphopantothenate--cysteine ligase CoaBC [Caldicoprobacterales bacterium]|jgi:phosphopantothenoylcysteine decarboxylase/phosphopantothenate--cysteine ligase|nr:bifunctional phosphopantothenoylcysteine decarboxylase/phosphopantothenate--cysteine ligase CoaBC [Clostridiales bacterium]
MNNAFAGKNILIGISGGIAAYKAADLTSRLIKLGSNVKVVMTKNATKFIHPLTLESLSGNQVYHDTFQTTERYDIEHIALAKWADIFVIVPATANVIGKAACGIADDLLSTTILATEAKTIIAPAMNTVMYQKKVVQDNLSKLEDLGYIIIPPGKGRLACGDWGEGKLADVDDIIKILEANLWQKKDLQGKRVLVTAGPTIEPIDPVRFISNRSSGKMGYAIAKACALRGAVVDLVTGPTHLEPPTGVNIHSVESAKEMYDTTIKLYENVDIVFKTAAVSDYRVQEVATNKIKKGSEPITLKLERNPDILLELGRTKKHQILVGFAAETQELEQYALKKLKDKNLDFILANDVSTKISGFQSDFNQGTLFCENGEAVTIPLMDKEEFAHRIVDEVIKHI